MPDQHDTADSEQGLRQALLEDEARLTRLDDDRTDGLLDDARWRRQTDRVAARIAERQK